MLSASSVLMNVLENQSTPSIREEQLSLNNAEVLSLGDSSPRSTISSSLIEIEEASDNQNSRIQNNDFHFQHQQRESEQDDDEFNQTKSDQEDDDEFSQFVLMEHCYDEEEENDEMENRSTIEETYNHQEATLKKPSPLKSKPLVNNEEFSASTRQPKENSFRSSFSSRSSLLKGTTTTTLRNSTSSSLNSSFGFGSSALRFSVDNSSNKPKSKSSPSLKRDYELENELFGNHNSNRPTTPTSKPVTRSTSPISKTAFTEEVIYTPPPDLSSITLKDKKEIEMTVERLKVRQRYLEDRVKRESTPPRGRVVPPKPKVYTSSERVITKPLYEKGQTLTLTQLQNSIEVEKRKKRIEEKRRELQELKNMRARAIREEKQKRETFLKEDSFLSRPIPETKRPSTPSLTKRTTPTPTNKRPSSSFAERPKSSISIETVKPQQRNITNHQTPKTSSRVIPKDAFSKQNSFLSDSSYKSQKDVKDFNALLREQEKLLNNIRELKNKIQPNPSSKK